MDLDITQDGSVTTIGITGKLSVATSPELEAVVLGQPESVSSFVMDLTNLEYISSAGLRVLVATEKLCVSRGGRMRLVHPADEVMEVFDMTGLTDIFDIEA